MITTDGRAVVAVRGEIDLSTRDQLWNAIEDGLAYGRRLVIDMSETEFIDSVGLGLLAQAHLRLRSNGEVLELQGPNSFTRRVLDLSGLLDLPTILVSKAADGAAGTRSAEIAS